MTLLKIGLVLSAAACVAACSDPAGPREAGGETPPTSAPTIGVLQTADFDRLEGELGCSFADADGETRLAALAVVAVEGTIDAVIRIDGSARDLSGPDGGDFGDLERGAALTDGSGLDVNVELGSNREDEDFNEASQRNAVLVVDFEDGTSTRIENGVWTCGP